ncbi:hypothetical protein ACFL2S_07700 [Thermodesulfobacteriota bacterium]
MKLMRIFLVVIVAVMLSACGSAEKQANKSQAELNKEKVKLSEQYQACMKKAEGDKEKEAECEKYLKAAEALK